MFDPKDRQSLPLCPLARTFILAGGTSLSDARCRGPECALFRWERITTAHPNWAASVKAVAAEMGEKPPYPKAARVVADDPVKYGLVPVRGYCGAGGQP